MIHSTLQSFFPNEIICVIKTYLSITDLYFITPSFLHTLDCQIQECRESKNGVITKFPSYYDNISSSLFQNLKLDWNYLRHENCLIFEVQNLSYIFNIYERLFDNDIRSYHLRVERFEECSFLNEKMVQKIEQVIQDKKLFLKYENDFLIVEQYEISEEAFEFSFFYNEYLEEVVKDELDFVVNEFTMFRPEIYGKIPMLKLVDDFVYRLHYDILQYILI